MRWGNPEGLQVRHNGVVEPPLCLKGAAGESIDADMRDVLRLFPIGRTLETMGLMHDETNMPI
jgi:hypothetical protein